MLLLEMKRKFNRAEKYENGIAKINIEGIIAPIKSAKQMLYGFPCDPDRTIREIDLADEDVNIKGLIISINSPGGYPVASCEIADRIALLKKPNVGLLRDMAASGGYIVASACQSIVAHQMSHIGSMGVLMPRFEYTKFMEKIGITYKSIKVGKYKDLGMPFKSLTKEEEEKLQNFANQIYEEFIELIAKNRNLPKEKVKELADGFVLLGREAKEAGLVDKVGTLQTAITICEEKGKFKHDKIVVRGRESLVERISGIFGRASYSVGFGIVKGMQNYDFRIR